MQNLAIIGGGFWGFACYLRAKENGIDNILLIDSMEELGASRNATGLVIPEWYKESSYSSDRFPERWNYEKIMNHFEWVQEQGNLEKTDFHFHNKVDQTQKIRSECHLLEKGTFLTYDELPEKDKFFGERVRHVEKKDGHYEIHFQEEIESIRSKKIVLAAGAWIDRILEKSGYMPLRVRCKLGRAFRFQPKGEHELPEEKPLKIMLSPFRYTWIRLQGGEYRAGDSTESVGCPEEVKLKDPFEEEYKERYLGDAEELMEDYEITDIVKGVRPFTTPVTVEEVDENFVVATGGGRIGLALSGIASYEASEKLGVIQK